MGGHRTLLGLVLVCVLLAGCGASVGPTGSPTPAAVPTDRPQERPFAPGVSADGFVETGTLVRAHERALANTSFTIESTRVERTTREAGQTTSRTVERRYEVEHPGRFRVVTTVRENGSRVPTDRPAVFADGELRYARYGGAADETVLSWPLGAAEGSGALDASVDIVLEALTVSNATVDRRYRGEVVYTFVQVAETTRQEGERRTRTVTARIRPSGLVEAVTVRTERRVDGRVETTVQSFTVESVGETTVERPAWVPRADGAERDGGE